MPCHPGETSRIVGAGYHSKEQTEVPKIPKGTFPETNSSHLRMDGWNTSFLLGCSILFFLSQF